MGFNVDGYLIVTQDTLVNSWNFGSLDPETIWHGNEHVQNVSAENIEVIDPEGDSIMRSTHGILQVTSRFLRVFSSLASGTRISLMAGLY